MNCNQNNLLLLVLFFGLAACTTVPPSDGQHAWQKPTLTTPGKFCMVDPQNSLGGIANITPEDQHAIGDCRHADWHRDDVIVLYFGDEERKSTGKLEEYLDRHLHPESYAAADGAIEPGCTSGTDCAASKQGLVIHFHLDQDKPFDQAEIDAIKQAARAAINSKKAIAVTGYTDSTGKAKHNKGLSIRRAEAIRKLLAESGLDANLVMTTGHGALQPVGANDTEEGRAANRRAEVKERSDGN